MMGNEGVKNLQILLERMLVRLGAPPKCLLITDLSLSHCIIYPLFFCTPTYTMFSLPISKIASRKHGLKNYKHKTRYTLNIFILTKYHTLQKN
jgi:hypothetical protein